jgi:hypothetical protein
MPDEALKPALRKALRLHEIGEESPYRLSFAGIGGSGGSFGFMQGDLARRPPRVRETFRRVLDASGVTSQQIEAWLQLLAAPVSRDPLGPADRERIDAALLAGRAMVDALDEYLFEGVCRYLDQCSDTAVATDRSITPQALLAMALWINKTGPPTKLLVWLSGADPGLPRPVREAPFVVDAAAIEGYLQATRYYTDHPDRLAHLREAVAAGAVDLP